MINLVLRAEGVIVSPVEVQLAEDVVPFQGPSTHTRVGFVLHLYLHWKNLELQKVKWLLVLFCLWNDKNLCNFFTQKHDMILCNRRILTKLYV